MKFLKGALTTAVAATASLMLMASPAVASDSASFGAKNCYNYQVLTWSTTSGGTYTAHNHTQSGVTRSRSWSTAGYHLYGVFTSVSSAYLYTNGSFVSPTSWGCDS